MEPLDQDRLLMAQNATKNMLEWHVELSPARNLSSTYTIDMKGNAFSLNAVCMLFAVGCWNRRFYDVRPTCMRVLISCMWWCII
jgi:hypothetical protein